VESPVGKSEEQVTIDIKDLVLGEEERYTAENIPKETGYISYTRIYTMDGEE
jgi:hypothetical protein